MRNHVNRLHGKQGGRYCLVAGIGKKVDEEQKAAKQSAETIDEPKTFTQAEVNQIVGKTKAKYKDYTDLKRKAAEYDKLQEESKSELQKATERAEKAESELTRLARESERAKWVEKAAKNSNVPRELLQYISAESEDDYLTIADEISEIIKKTYQSKNIIVENDGVQTPVQATRNASDWMRSSLPQRYHH